MTLNENENFVLYLETTSIVVREGLDRYRKDMVNLDKLAESIKTMGQLQPILITDNYELVAGGRRLAACILLGIRVKAIFKRDVSDIQLREMELEENLQRENLTPAEEVLAVSEIHALRQARFGTAVSGKKDSGWRLEDTGALMGKTKSSIVEDLALAAAIKEFPSLSNCKSKSDIRKAAKSIEASMDRLQRMSTFEATVKESGVPATVVVADAVEHMKAMPDKSVNLLLTDPPYGIDIDEIAIQMGGVTGGEHTTSGYKFSDNREAALGLFGNLAVESYRFCSDTAHAYVFCAPENFTLIRELFLAVGWLVRIKPIIWIKRESGQNNAPHVWPSSAYEFILFARKQDSCLVFQGKPDWIQCDPIMPSLKVHPTEKPVNLLEELILRCSKTGDTLYDPFMGSGSAMVAGLGMSMIVVGCDILEESYATTCAKIAAWLEKSEAIKARALTAYGDLDATEQN